MSSVSRLPKIAAITATTILSALFEKIAYYSCFIILWISYALACGKNHYHVASQFREILISFGIDCLIALLENKNGLILFPKNIIDCRLNWSRCWLGS